MVVGSFIFVSETRQLGEQLALEMDRTFAQTKQCGNPR